MLLSILQCTGQPHPGNHSPTPPTKTPTATQLQTTCPLKTVLLFFLIRSSQQWVVHCGFLGKYFGLKSTMKFQPLCFNLRVKICKDGGLWRDREKASGHGSKSCYCVLTSCVIKPCSFTSKSQAPHLFEEESLTDLLLKGLNYTAYIEYLVCAMC